MRGRSGVLSIAVRAPNRLELSHTSKVCGRPPTGPQISARSRKTCFRLGGFRLCDDTDMRLE
eukprot:2356442-Pyramimonas_sp.AAC.1